MTRRVTAYLLGTHVRVVPGAELLGVGLDEHDNPVVFAVVERAHNDEERELRRLVLVSVGGIVPPQAGRYLGRVQVPRKPAKHVWEEATPP